MLGKAHALSGGAAWLIGAPAIATLANNASWLPDMNLTMSTYALGAVAATGAALAPDLDHPSRSFARGALGPVTESISSAAGMFGHRTLTHSWFGIGIATGALIVLANMGGLLGNIYAASITFLMTAFALAAFYSDYSRSKNKRFIIRAIIAAGVTVATVFVAGGDYGWLAIAYALGLTIHCLGDSLTVEGVPWLWPMKSWNYKISPAIFLALYTIPVAIILYSLSVIATIIVVGAALVLAGAMLKPIRAGDWQEKMLLTPVFIATGVAAIVSISITTFAAGGPQVAGYPVENKPVPTQSAAPAEALTVPLKTRISELEATVSKPAGTPVDVESAKGKNKNKGKNKGKSKNKN